MSALRAMTPEEYFERTAERLELAPMPGSRPLRHIPAARRVNMDATPVLLDRRAVERAAHARGMSKIPTTTADITLAQAEGRAEVPRWKAESLAVLLGVELAALTTPPRAGETPAPKKGADMPESKKYPCPIRGCTFGSDKPNGLKIHIGRAHKELGDAAFQRAEEVIRAIDSGSLIERAKAFNPTEDAEPQAEPVEVVPANTPTPMSSTEVAEPDVSDDQPVFGHCPHVDACTADPSATDCGADPCNLVPSWEGAGPIKVSHGAAELVGIDCSPGPDMNVAVVYELVDAKLELVTMLMVNGSFEESERMVANLDRVRELLREVAS